MNQAVATGRDGYQNHRHHRGPVPSLLRAAKSPRHESPRKSPALNGEKKFSP